MTGPVTMPGVLVGVTTGFGAGVLFAVARRAWKDHATISRAAGPAARTAWKRTIEMLILGFLLAVVAAYAIGEFSTP
jgi:hypothetical protein